MHSKTNFMLLKKLVSLSLGFLLLTPFYSLNAQNKEKKITSPNVIDGHAAWIMQGNIYEVNVRQYTPEGTFKAFAKSLPRLKKMGVQTLWFMPINPIGILDRKGILGSYYAIRNYREINPEFGTMADFNALVKQCHEMGFKVIIDWVANHTAADHYWLTSNPDFYVQDSITHKAVSPFDWTDARKLNYSNPKLCDSMTATMEFWLNNSHIDGFRCDVADEVPQAFWTKCIAKLRKGRNIFMLAESEKPWIHDAGFDATYTWSIFSKYSDIAKGTRNALALDTALNIAKSKFQKNALRMYFTSNHDENSWNKADYGTTPGITHAPFAVFTQTIYNSVPLIYSGQEEPYLDSISFFYKNTIHFGKYERANFYSKLLALRKSNPALAANATFTKLKSSNDDNIFSYLKTSSKDKILVILNLNKNAIKATVDGAINGKAVELFSNEIANLNDGQKFDMQPWGYKVFVYKND